MGDTHFIHELGPQLGAGSIEATLQDAAPVTVHGHLVHDRDKGITHNLFARLCNHPPPIELPSITLLRHKLKSVERKLVSCIVVNHARLETPSRADCTQ